MVDNCGGKGNDEKKKKMKIQCSLVVKSNQDVKKEVKQHQGQRKIYLVLCEMCAINNDIV